ncbi:helicase-related protein [Glutamicibacter sp. MNS18]|uniref:DEAD/DEAH box helicase n=1 Tax=Glutamicibacter sp. MNS18 TaxID=2989817 RepID=UPI002235A790|nr:helicase-related protein [Glutamicibacter sp. MNS18]MCW4466814.1 helicase-related protein [Glutamicibacter sp. MNS18]
MGQVNAARWVGLTSTPYRADELNGLITMQCGPIRYDLDSPLAATRELRIHHTDFEPESHETDGAGMQELCNEIAHDEQRNRQIVELIMAELSDGRHCLVLSNRTQHIHSLTELVQEAGIEAPVIGLHGKLGKKERQEVTGTLQLVDAAGFAYVVIASDKIADEGFNLPGLDTLFLVSPVSFKGKIEQLIGRIQRTDDAERVIQIHDFVDSNVGVFEAMARRRHHVIRKRGFNLSMANQTALLAGD